MMMNNESFFSQDVIALTTEREEDFSQKSGQFFLTDLQRKYLLEKYGLSFEREANIHQVHSNKVMVLNNSKASQGEEADGIVTNLANVAILIRTADCLPVFLADEVSHCIGLIHCGWKSTKGGILKNAISVMQKEFSASVETIKVFLGPAIGQCCYQVGEEFLEYFPENVHRREGKLFFDLARENIHQLLALEIRGNNICESGICTCCNERYFSYRRDGEKAGRMLSLLMMKG